MSGNLQLVISPRFQPTSRGMECASDVSIQRRRICCTVIWIGDAQSTYLLNLFHFRQWQPAKPRTGKWFQTLHCCRNLVSILVYYSELSCIRTFSCLEQGRRKVFSERCFISFLPHKPVNFTGMFVARTMHSTPIIRNDVSD